jgi:hypothetical protein
MKITDRDIKRAAVLRAAGFEVKTIKLQCNPRCAFLYEDTPETRKLIEDYEQRRILPIPIKAVMVAYGILISESKDLQAGRLGGAL